MSTHFGRDRQQARDGGGREQRLEDPHEQLVHRAGGLDPASRPRRRGPRRRRRGRRAGAAGGLRTPGASTRRPAARAGRPGARPRSASRPGRPIPARAANPRTVGWAYMSRIGTGGRSGSSRSRVATRARVSEFAPRSSTTWLSTETRSRSRTSANAAASCSSRRVASDDVPARGSPPGRRCRQGTPVDLAARHHRDVRESLEVGRHHVRGQGTAQAHHQGLLVERDAVLAAVVADQLGHARLRRVRRDDRLRDPRDGGEDGLDLTELHPVAPILTWESARPT